MATRHINMNNDRKSFASKQKPPVKDRSLKNAIIALQSARKFIVMFNGSTEDIDYAINYFKRKQ